MPKRTEFVSFDESLPEEQARSVDAWQHPTESIEPKEAADLSLLMELAARLTKVLSFISAGNETETMDMRAWVVMKQLRPDLLKGETLRQYAGRRGVSFSRLNNLAREFQKLFPGLKLGRQSGGRRRAHPPVGSLLKTASK
jgi:hypothetical protein